MNTPIRRIAVLAMVLFAALLLNVSQIVIVQQDSLNANPQNRRVRDEQFGGHRGSIVAGKTTLAVSNPAPQGSQFGYQRSYPQGELYAPITGYFSYDRGTTALERAYNGELAGTSNSLFVRRLVDILTGRSPQGATVETTIDPKAQQAAAQALGHQQGAVVALDAQTGAVLAMVSSPSYDPTSLSGTDIKGAGTRTDPSSRTPTSR
ncbi:penicillin-binding transpeptidase domain-containing protein [Raineyella fluvialis]|uniref:penicillin-binding transpeptidase domain-containing protein n=1 Tax=Raineyella fluvialis TaxID=2662261 RepID=UPI001EEFD9BB|nr:penicillin-binding transpeptidase domain-containing protein [Raineyella fluvialis]